MYIVFDTETTGLPRDYNAPMSDVDNWPRLVQLAWQLHDVKGKLLSNHNYIIRPEGFTIPYNAEKVHGISTKRALAEGHELREILQIFREDVVQAKYLVGHNIGFDINVVGSEYIRAELFMPLGEKKELDTKDISTDFCALPGGRGGKFKWPTLTELHQKLFGKGFGDAHDAAYDVDATARCFFGLITQGVHPPEPGIVVEEVIYEAPTLAEANFAQAKDETKAAAKDILKQAGRADISDLADLPFTHLHVHSQYSVLQATSEIPALVARAKALNMKAIAMTDHGNMMGAFHFVKEAMSKDIKPILGCEFNLCRDRKNKSNKDDGYQTVLLAKNKAGYHNLAKLASYANIDGFYYVPRIDKELLVQYKGDLIATTGGLWGEVPYLILNVGDTQAEEAFLWWKEQFGEDFYVELNRHGIPEEEKVNEVLMEFARKHGVKYFAANNTYYNDKTDAKSHDILLCVKDGELVEKPKKYIGKRGREFRYGFPNDEFYIKSSEEMKKLFSDLPEAIACTQEIVDKVEAYKLAREVLLPKFDIPAEFIADEDAVDGGKRGENAYLRHLTYEGANKRYPEITQEIRERLDFELATIEKTGYPGYFLIVQDFIVEARKMGVSVGPGRGSAAGSAVAYCTGITNIDPIAYNLLFERFLNPDRVSLPDIDIDFDDEGRQSVIDYVIKKYGSNQVAQIITYGTMAAKSAIRDTARVLNLPLAEAGRLASLVPDMKLKTLFSLQGNRAAIADKLRDQDMVTKAEELIRISKGNDESAKTISQAAMLEGSVRNLGIHACGVIITPSDITNFVPVALAKDSEMVCTQFDNSVVESAGLLKMDFLGLKTLTLIKDAIKIVKERHGIQLDADEFPIDDTLTYELFQRGETVGIFQYESPGMQKYMRELKPTVFADLIAMNALYRPGPIAYIPSFVKRKHGTEPITYDLDDMKEYLEETYGITVYQEQVMLLSQKLAGFTKGEADVLRKAMGKKQKDVLDKMKPKFIEQASAKGHDAKRLAKIWTDWEAFASYAFNKSHSTCYAWIAYQTAYLKAHYPAEYMASVLSNNMNDITQVTFFMEECKRMGIKVAGPDVNESKGGFTVNKIGEIRFGMAAIKGAGSAAVEEIIKERELKGPYKNIFEFAKRVNSRALNKKTMEALAMAGAFDCFKEHHRRQYLEAPENDLSLIEKATKYAQKVQQEEDSAQVSLFGGGSGNMEIPLPSVAPMEPFSQIQQLNIEKEVVGLFISGHPLDEFRLEIDAFTNTALPALADPESLKGKSELKLAGSVSAFAHRTTKNGKPFGTLTLEDYSGSFTFFLFGDDYVRFKEYFMTGWYVFLSCTVTQKKWGGDNELEVKINSMMLLSEVRGKMVKGLRINIDLDNLTLDLMEKLEAITTKYKGDAKLYIDVIDRKENIALELFCKKFTIDPNARMIKELQGIPDVVYKVI